MRKIIAISNNFPTPHFPEKGVFVMNALQHMARQENTSVDVIAPTSSIARLKTLKVKKEAAELFPRELHIIQPDFIALPLRLPFKKKWLVALNNFLFSQKVKSNFPQADYSFAYSHFYPSGVGLLGFFRKKKIPFFVNLGESDLAPYDGVYGANTWIENLKKFTGVITVSKAHFNYLKKRDAALGEKLCYIPNGVNNLLFKPMDKAACRQQLGLPQNEKIVIFCGHFIARKGPLKVLEACRRLNIKGVFLGGNGSEVPEGEHVLYAGSVVNTDLPLWLNAADVFCLPSLAEGMSNAILEAMSCGVPLVVSDRPFNTGFIPEGSAVFVDPESIGEITEGLRKVLFEPGMIEHYCQQSMTLAPDFSLQRRIERIFSFVDKMTQN